MVVTSDSRAEGVQSAEDGVESSKPAADIKCDGIQLVLARSEKIRLELELVLTRVAMRFDGVSEPSSGYNRPADYEHDYMHGQAEGPEPSDADEGLADRG